MYDNETFRNKIHDLLGRLLRQCDRTRNATVYDYEVKDLQKYFDTLEKRKDQPIKYVWLDINTGKFSNSWTDGSHEYYASDLTTVENLQYAKDNGHKLVRYNVLNDPDFEFYNLMMVTNTKSK